MIKELLKHFQIVDGNNAFGESLHESTLGVAQNDESQITVLQPDGELGALLLAIAKWTKLYQLVKARNFLYSDGGGETCAMCSYYHDCFYCPLDCYVGSYVAWAMHYADAVLDSDSDVAKGLELIDDELDYLLSFLPGDLYFGVADEVDELLR